MTELLNAGEICSRIVVVAERSTPLVEAARRMRETHVGCLVVVEPGPGGGRTVVGMLTDRDIVTAVIAHGLDLRALRVEDVMTADVVTVTEDTPFAELMATLRRRGLRRLPVVGAEGRLVGLVTLDDLLEVLAEQMRAIVQAIATEQRHERERRRQGRQPGSPAPAACAAAGPGPT